MKTLVLGLGNPIVRDDALGPIVADQLAREVPVEAQSGTISGLALLDCVTGYDRLIVVDATQSGADAPGTVRRIDLDLSTRGAPPLSRHGWGIADVLAFGRRTGVAVPSQVVVYTMEAGDLSDFGEGLTPQVRAAIPGMVKRILGEEFAQPLLDSTCTKRGDQCQTG